MATSEETGSAKVAAVVLNWCNEDDTAACVRALLRSDYPDFQVLLVDNGSPDGSGERVHRAFPDIPYLQTGANLGYTGGNNVGIRWARENGADFIFILNNDTIVETDTVTALVDAALSRQGVGAVAPRILQLDDPGHVWYGGGTFSRRRGLGVHHHERRNGAGSASRDLQEVTFVTGCACLFSSEALDRVGGFAEDFFAYVEDAEISVRLRRAGYRLLYEPGATVLHRTEPVHADPGAMQIRLRDRNRRRLMRRHFSLLERLPFLARFYASRLVHLARYAVRGDLERVRAVFRGMLER